MRITINLLMCILLLTAAWHFALAGKVYAKAWLAQELLTQAWSQSNSGLDAVKPWPWADFWPIAKLTVPRLGIEQLVLAGDSGNVLAFAPGYTRSSVSLGEPGITLFSGHRDTHFNFLKDLIAGDELLIQGPSGTYVYQVELAHVVDQTNFSVPRSGTFLTSLSSNQMPQHEQSQLLLVTCYPFDAIEQSDYRYLVLATKKASEV
jgi:sortase A